MIGATHYFLPKFDPISVLKAIQEHKLSAILMVPTMLTILSHHPEIRNYNLESVKTVVYGASPIAENILLSLFKILPNANFVQAYGMTELSPVTTLLDPESHRDGNSKLKSAGRPVPHAEVRIVDLSNQEVPIKTVGEIVR
jgi:acyl-CoA synthetase (AMP-forming)/AMP-acid ligase II